MNTDRNPKNQVGTNRPKSVFGRIERVPLGTMVLLLALAAITIMFAVLVVAYVSARAGSTQLPGLHPFPRYFSLSTIIIVLSSYVLAQAPRLYKQDDLTMLGRCLLASLLLGAVFAGLQMLGWRELTQQGVKFQGESSGTFVYLISALHVLHLLGGMAFLLFMLVSVTHADRDAVRHLVYIRNPYRRRQLRLLSIYWHFIDVLWVALFAVFLFLY